MNPAVSRFGRFVTFENDGGPSPRFTSVTAARSPVTSMATASLIRRTRPL